MWNKIKNIEERSKIFPWVLGCFCAVAIGSFWGIAASSAKPKVEVPIVRVSPFENIQISAKSAVVYDLANHKIIYEKNADEPRPLASLTKIMTALTATEISSSTESVAFASSTWNLKSLIDYTLIVSSNNGASAIAALENPNKQIFINKMNLEAAKVGLLNSKFINEHGLDEDPDHVGAYGSARDMQKLFQYIILNYPHLLEATKYQSLNIEDQIGGVYKAVNTNISVNEIPSLIASKTGFTDLAGGNLVIAYDAGLDQPVIISVLGSTLDGRFEDVLKLVETTRKYINNN